MRYREYRPCLGLRGIVHRFWVLQGACGRPADFERAMPDGRPELIFNLAHAFESRGPAGTVRQPRTLLVGPTTRALLLRPRGRVDLVGARLRPGGWPGLFRVEGRELLDRAVDPAELARQWREDILGPLSESPGDAARIALLERRLLRAIAWSRPPDPRLAAAVDATLGGAIPVPRLAERLGLGERQLTRLFRTGTGVGPGLLGRLGRFQRVLRELERPDAPRWPALALRHGYVDQAHLCRDFRRFAGISPGRYVRATREVARNFVDAGP